MATASSSARRCRIKLRTSRVAQNHCVSRLSRLSSRGVKSEQLLVRTSAAVSSTRHETVGKTLPVVNRLLGIRRLGTQKLKPTILDESPVPLKIVAISTHSGCEGIPTENRKIDFQRKLTHKNCSELLVSHHMLPQTRDPCECCGNP